MRILFVSMVDSVHAARWVNQIAGQGWDVHLFPVGDATPHRDFRDVTIYSFSTRRPPGLHRSVRLRGLWPLRRGEYRLKQIGGRLFPRRNSRSAWLASVIRWLKPDIIHSQEIQHAGYLTLETRSKFGGEFPKWIVANWGSDIYLYGRLPEHAERIREVLAACDYYHCECHRDLGLARQFGFKGEALPVCPVSGGFEVESMRQLRQPGPTSARHVIVLKGYQNWAGRALVGLRAIEMCADALKGYRLAIHMTTPEVELAGRLLEANTGIPVEFDFGGAGNLRREDILRMHGSARVSIGLSISDAISTSLLEAMIMGAFPIQSNTGCGDEWLCQGKSGLLVPAEEPSAVAAALRLALADDELVDRAAEINAHVASKRLDLSVIRPQVIEMYKRIANARPKNG
ncbi:MAG TPA: glycosyltransferase [Pyrinomonadaceae bacterium]|nr:glycosyltransferase [Pyrinomonadaceae bacterium]